HRVRLSQRRGRRSVSRNHADTHGIPSQMAMGKRVVCLCDLGLFDPALGLHRGHRTPSLSGARGSAAGSVLLTIAVIMLSIAGKRRDKVLRGSAPAEPAERQTGRGNFALGLILCILC